jgi:hypothetical protein
MIWGGNVHTVQNGKLLDYSEHYTESAENGTNKLFGMCSKKLTDNQTHALIAGDKGGAFLSLEKWPEGVRPDSVTINWKGDPVDPAHGKIIKTLENKNVE